MPAWIDRLKRRQHPCAFRFRSSNSIRAIAFYHYPKSGGQPFNPFGTGILFSLDEDLRLPTNNALCGIARNREIMSDEPGSDDFHVREEKR